MLYSALSPEEERVLLVLEFSEIFLVLIDDFLVHIDKTIDIFANCLRQDKLGAQAMTLVELSSETGQLTHNFDEVALRLGVFELHLISFLVLLDQLLL